MSTERAVRHLRGIGFKDLVTSFILISFHSYRHHHTHHHTHVYPIYGTPYVNPAAVLGTQPAVAVINPFANPTPK